jgi:putative ABC transport system permease protein
MRALGFKQYGVKVLFSIEGALLGLLGSAAGSLLFLLAYAVITLVKPTYVPPANSTPVPLRIDLVWQAMAVNVCFMLVLSLIAAFVPARKSARMSIVDALGHI